MDRQALFRNLCIDKHGAKNNEVAKLRMNHISMDPHLPQPRRNRYWLVRHDPDPAREICDLHGKPG